jgi:RNA polymerase sigma factor (sigma-70 family)
MSRELRVEVLLRASAPRALGAVVRRFDNFADSEDAVQEAMLAAASQWPTQGAPENPVGWLIHVASRRMTDHMRGEQARNRREGLAAALEIPAAASAASDHDDTLTLMFMCAHPALSEGSAIALTLRAVAGLTTAEIANAFLVPEATMAQRISRAKQSIKVSGVPFAMPEASEGAGRLRSVLRVLYLIFNEGYLPSSGTHLAREELSGEAIRLTRILRLSLPEDPEVTGLLALMLLTEARRRARTDARGELISLADQDRSLWSQELIAEGVALVAEALEAGSVGEYQLQAAIAAAHDRARRADDTDWRGILGLYELLERITRNPMVALNRAIASAMVDGPKAGLALLQALEAPLAGNHRLHAVRAHLLEKAGELDAAIADYQVAATRTRSLPERSYLLTQAARLSAKQHLKASRCHKRDEPFKDDQAPHVGEPEVEQQQVHCPLPADAQGLSALVGER